MPEHVYDPPERFVAGSVGPPGQRTFFLQAGDGDRRTTVSLEKEQVRLLGVSLGELLDEVSPEEGSEDAAAPFVDNAPLDGPFDDDFRVQRLSVAWDAGRERVVLEAFDRPEAEDLLELDPTEDYPWTGRVPQSLTVVLGPARARAFALRCTASLEGGRPSCPFCGQPLDPGGHVCPRANGYKR
ncbi:hypothetical protein BJF81_01620 [Ornithinimicrobium sp. CNJ-824]|jgi:uncharacterized repeat protein (TIGR03847 family)|uniref:DUF3090 family protein n=1 Tax=Ornithinimicrobium sp. CNJ-824 TaxID=1904966 RepID=UPI0009632320|nr:DUF3090 family protein [Ornithinimicrobium sp. CNJ-824]OLT22654.1 hypothetical protein BJF81_01620 [Ornithinimicrobium sp. CNJ-824]